MKSNEEKSNWKDRCVWGLTRQITSILVRSSFSLVYYSTVFFSKGLLICPLLRSPVRPGPPSDLDRDLGYLGGQWGFLPCGLDTGHPWPPFQFCVIVNALLQPDHFGGRLWSVSFCLSNDRQRSEKDFPMEFMYFFFQNLLDLGCGVFLLFLSLLHPLGHSPLSNA